MGRKKYTDVQIAWLETNGCAQVWENRAEFRAAFNKAFNLDVSESKFNNLILWHGIKICTKQTESIFSQEQKQWLIDNARSGLFKNCKHLTATYNALFGECRRSENINGYLCAWGVELNTDYKGLRYTPEMDAWLKENYLLFKTVDEATDAFNQAFGESRSAAAIAHHCRNMGLKRDLTRFKKGHNGGRTQPVGAIVYRRDYPWIKVHEGGDKSSWMPLHKYVWEQVNGEVPEGYCVVFVGNDNKDVSIENVVLIDRRGTPTMAKYGWWDIDNPIIKKTAIQWCNLHCVLKNK